MPNPSGAPQRASRPTKKNPKGRAPKSQKSDGTPKQRWNAAERAERGRPPRRSAGRGAEPQTWTNRPEREDRPRRFGSTEDRPRRFERDERPRSFDSAGERPRRFDSTEDRTRRFERDERPRSFDSAGERPRRFDNTEDRPRRFERDERPRSFDSAGDRPRRFDNTEDRTRRFDRDDRPRRVDNDDRRSSRRPAERETWGRPDRRTEQRFDRAPRESFDDGPDQMSWSAERFDTEVSAPAVPVTSGNGFARLGVPNTLVQALATAGINDPFPIQAATIPDALAGRDVLGRGRTGSGKTLGFGLPMLTRLAGSRAASGTARSIVLVPTRELALQVADVIAPLARTMNLTVALITGGMAYGPQLKSFAAGVDIAVATPGRLIDLLDQGAADLSRVEITVLDEADHMADLGFLPAVTQILDTVPGGGQRLLFSATLDSGVDRLVRRYLSDPVSHETDPGQASVSTMAHHVLNVRPHDKADLTAEIAGRPGRTVIFVRTQRGADRVAEQLREAGVLAGALHGGLTQGARARILAAFKDGKLPVLVATDVAARGIHVDEVGLVLQVDPPAGPKDYLHRAGRTARAGEPGTVVTLTLPHQRREVRRLTDQAGVKVEPLDAAPGDERVADLVGARQPSGVAIEQATYDKVIAPPQRVSRRRSGPPARPHQRGPRRGSWGGAQGREH